MFKILTNLVPNPRVDFIFKQSARHGTMAIVPLIPTGLLTTIKNLRHNHFNFIGPLLFNLLPFELRNFNSDRTNVVFAFKTKLDEFLSKFS